MVARYSLLMSLPLGIYLFVLLHHATFVADLYLAVLLFYYMASSSSIYANTSTIGDTIPKFPPSVDIEKYKCCKCLSVLRPPVRQTICGHRLCGSCLEEVLKSDDTMCPGQAFDDEGCVDLKEADAVS